MVEWKKLEEVFELRNGYTPSKSNPEFWTDGTIPWFRMEDIRQNGRILSDSIQHITPEAVKKSGLFPAHTIIVATTATIGEHALVIVDSLANQRFTGLITRKSLTRSVLPRFAYYYCFLLDDWCKKHVHQGGFSSVDMDGFKKFPFPIPSLREQERIVSILDTFTAAIDNLKKQIEERRKQYEFYRDQLLDLEGKEGVEIRSIEELCDYVDYRGKTPAKTNKGIFLVTAKNIKKGYIDYNISKEYIDENDYEVVMRRGKPTIGDVVITTEAPCGNVAQIDKENIALAQRVIKYRAKDNRLNNSYLKYALLGKQFQTNLYKNANGGTVKGIKGSVLYKMTIPVPPLSQQQQIVAKLDAFEASIANLEQQLAMRQKQYEYYRNKLLTFE